MPDGSGFYSRQISHYVEPNRVQMPGGGGGGGTREFEWNFKRFKEGIKERKLFLEHQQTVAPNPRVHQVGRGLFGCPYINF